MEQRKIYVCPSCKCWYSQAIHEKKPVCPSCHHELVETDIDYNAFSAMAKEDKQSFKQHFLDTHELPMTPVVDDTEESSSSGWISGLKFFSWILFFVIIILGLLLAIPYFSYRSHTEYGFLIIVASFLLAFLSVAGTMVFLEMASDLKAIRKALENTDKKQ